jgi:hypothetical protein
MNTGCTHVAESAEVTAEEVPTAQPPRSLWRTSNEILGPRHHWIAGRRLSCSGHGRLTSGLAFGPRWKVGICRSFSRDQLTPRVLCPVQVSAAQGPPD